MTESLLLKIPFVHGLIGGDIVLWGNVLVLLVTVGLFAKTLALGRVKAPAPKADDVTKVKPSTSASASQG